MAIERVEKARYRLAWIGFVGQDVTKTVRPVACAVAVRTPLMHPAASRRLMIRTAKPDFRQASPATKENGQGNFQWSVGQRSPEPFPRTIDVASRAPVPVRDSPIAM